MEFPIYRKYINEKSYFRIRSASEFDEIIKIGSNYAFTSYIARILPDRVLIEDMIQNTNKHWNDSTQEEFDKAFDKYKAQKNN